MSVTAGVSDVALAVRDKLRGKITQTKVKRYWPGKAPEWAEDTEEDLHLKSSLHTAFPSENLTVSFKDDPRLRRLALSKSDNRDQVRADHRRIRQAQVVSTAAESDEDEEAEEEEDEEALEEKRRKIREKLLRERIDEEVNLGDAEEEEDEEEEEEEEEEESEYETDDEDEGIGIAMVKPVFVPKSERETVLERERMEEEERKLEDKEKHKLELRKIETKQILVEEIKKEEMVERNLELEGNVADVDTDDEANEAEEYEAWKAREISRIKRDREAREAAVREREEVEKVRNMTEEERREWERRNPKPVSGNKQKWRFMQKYFHKGAFFQENADDRAATAGADDIYRRDFSGPTGEDKMDKSILPKVMQVKHFGRSGRTKWTHLVNEDTTDWNNPWTYNDPLRAKYNAKMAGMNAPIAKPKGSKKLKDWEKR